MLLRQTQLKSHCQRYKRSSNISNMQTADAKSINKLIARMLWQTKVVGCRGEEAIIDPL